MPQWTVPSLVQKMACRLFHTKPLSKPMLWYYWLDPRNNLHSRKFILKCRLQNGEHFVSASVCKTLRPKPNSCHIAATISYALSWKKCVPLWLKFRWILIPSGLLDKKSTSVQVMVLPEQATNYYLNQCWPRCLMPLWMNTLRPRQNGGHFADDIFKCIVLNESVWISIKMPQKFVPKGPINNILALVQKMDCRRPGDKPLSEPIVVRLNTHLCVIRPQWVNMTEATYCHKKLYHFHTTCYKSIK